MSLPNMHEQKMAQIVVCAAILTTIRVVAECAEDQDYKTTGCIRPRRIYPVVSIIMKCYLSERISFKEYLDNFYSEFNEK